MNGIMSCPKCNGTGTAPAPFGIQFMNGWKPCETQTRICPECNGSKLMAIPNPPHCSGHRQFEYDCLECADVINGSKP